MKPIVRSSIIAVLHVALVASLAGKLLYDRAFLPRGWAQTAPYDPTLPIRGRYVSLQLEVGARGVAETQPGSRWHPGQPVVLRTENQWLVADPRPEKGYDPSAPRLRFTQRQNEKVAVLDKPVAFFIPEHIPDPSRRAPNEDLYVEVTIPSKGPPRPIRLGVSKDKGPIVPLELR